MRFAAFATANSRCKVLSEDDLAIVCDPKYQVEPELRRCCTNCLAFAISNKTEDDPCFIPQPYLTWNYTYNSTLDSASQYTIPGISQELMWVVIMASVYQSLIVIFESGILKKIENLMSKVLFGGFTSKDSFESDGDVLAEKERVRGMTNTSEDVILVKDLKKSYGGFSAVKELNFGVHHGECFGLLGVNGAGFSTTFSTQIR
jgi:hypothetical protein